MDIYRTGVRCEIHRRVDTQRGSTGDIGSPDPRAGPPRSWASTYDTHVICRMSPVTCGRDWVSDAKFASVLGLRCPVTQLVSAPVGIPSCASGAFGSTVAPGPFRGGSSVWTFRPMPVPSYERARMSSGTGPSRGGSGRPYGRVLF